MATDYGAMNITPELESLKNEESYLASAFNNSYKFNGVKGLALKLQDLILMEPGTNPSALDMGCNIRSFLFEFLDDASLTMMNNLVTEQQRRFLPSDLIRSMNFIKSPKVDEPNTLYLFVHLNSEDDGYIPKYFAIGFSSNAKNNIKVDSQVYL